MKKLKPPVTINPKAPAMTPMQQLQAVNHLGSARMEIENLRKRVAHLQPLADAYEVLAKAVRLAKEDNGGWILGSDVAHEIQQFLAQVKS